MGLLVGLVIAAIFRGEGLASFGAEFTPPASALSFQAKRDTCVGRRDKSRDGTHPKNIPPFTWMFCPVMKLAPGPQRKRTAAAMSGGSPRRPTSARTSE